MITEFHDRRLRPSPAVEWTARASAVACALMAEAARSGDYLKRSALRSVAAHFHGAPMAPSTTISLVGLSAALLMILSNVRRREKWARIGAVVFSLLPALRLFEWLCGVSPGTVHGFIGDFGPAASFSVVGMSLPINMGLMAAALTIVMLPYAARNALLNLCSLAPAICVLGLGAVFAVGYAYGNPLIYGSTSLFAALSFIFLGTALTLTSWGRDFAQRSAIADELVQGEERHSAVIEQSAEGIYLIDARNRQVIESNPTMTRLLGFTAEEFRGKPVHEFFGEMRGAVEERLVKALYSQVPVVAEQRYVRKDGSTVDVGTSMSLIRYGNRRALCVIVRDISQGVADKEVLEANNEQLRLTNEANGLSDQASVRAQIELAQSEQVAGVGRMAAGISHEIERPLSFVTNNIALFRRELTDLKSDLESHRGKDVAIALEDRELGAEIAAAAQHPDPNFTLKQLDDALTASEDGLRRIQQIVEELRDFARSDRDEFTESDLNEGIHMTAGDIAGIAEKKKVEIDLHLLPLPNIMCVRAKINRVVMNLMRNAIDASKPGSKVIISTRVAGDEVVIEVADSGVGIGPAVLQKIFDPFFSTKPAAERTGLGLSVSNAIVQDHQGRIEVDSALGRGSRFIVHLPVRTAISAAA
jgi:PAS domain S-box-containing protein